MASGIIVRKTKRIVMPSAAASDLHRQRYVRAANIIGDRDEIVMTVRKG